MAGGTLQKFFFHHRGIQHPTYHLRLDHGRYHAVRAIGHLRHMDPYEDLLEDMALLRWLLIESEAPPEERKASGRPLERV